MKRFAAIVSSLLIAASTLLPFQSVSAAGTNLIANPSFETGTTAPTSWAKGNWGTNTPSFTYSANAHTGTKSATVTVSGFSSGDAKWYATPVAITPNTSYTYSDWYQSSVVTEVDAVITTTTNQTVYMWLGNPAASATWAQTNYTFTAPANAKSITFYHSLYSNGSLTIDDVSLVNNSVTPTPTPTPTPPTVQVTAPAANATVSGTQSVTAAASDAQGLTSVQFKLDGANLGTADTTAPYSVSWDTKTATNGSHTLSAVATNTANLTTTATDVAVTVSNTTTTPVPPTTGSNLVPNPSVETAQTATSPLSWVSNSWGANTRTFSYLATGRTGGRSIKTDVTSYTNGDAKWYFNEVAVAPGKTYQYSNWYQSNIDTEIDVAVTMTNGTVQYFYLMTAPASTVWAQAKTQFTVPTGAKSMTVFQVVAKKGYVISDDFSLSEYTPAAFNRALVSLTFDDGWRSIYTNGLPLLTKYNLPSTQYLLTETTDYPDYMTIAMMQEFKNKGHEIASHTISHPHLPQLTIAQLTTELATSQSQLRQWFGATTAKNFATPFGEYNATVVNEIKKYYRSHRSTDVGFNSKDSFNIYNIKVQNITNTTTPAQVQTWVNQAIANKTWLVLVYHEVGSAVEDPTYAVTPANLDQELNLIKLSGVTVKTVDQALDELVPQL